MFDPSLSHNTMFDSRSAIYKFPVGAVAEQTQVHFKLQLPRSLGCSAAYMTVQCEGVAWDTLSMYWCAMEGDGFEWWEVDYIPNAPGLFRYSFSLQTATGTRLLQRAATGEAVFEGGAQWQQTVYAKDFTTPDWLTGGLIYQIFPDRFFASGTEKHDVPADRTLRGDWGGEPEWRPDAQGRVRNADYFGGDLGGITLKLDYLASLGVSCLYLNPIFEAHSNHRYNTANYRKIDPLLGSEADFTALCKEAEKRGMRVILDGVFSHTGDDSIYFNKARRYPGDGAYNSQESPYYHWFHFFQWPDKYQSWWGFDTLPEVNELSADFDAFINGEDGVARQWLRSGAAGWRLDVADELPDGFLDNLRIAVKAENPDAVIIGEVWEDASNKEAYGQTRRYFHGQQLDSVMNYPFRDAVLGFWGGRLNGGQVLSILLGILENYPRQVIRVLMNLIGTHDTERALTVLAGEPSYDRGRDWQSVQHLSPEARAHGLRLLRPAALMQYTLPGVPCLYYGDEAGVEGYRDPFNRTCFPWGHEDTALLDWYKTLGKLRRSLSCLHDGDFIPFLCDERQLGYIRADKNDKLLVLLNAGDKAYTVPLPLHWAVAQTVIGPKAERRQIVLEPYGCAAIALTGEKQQP